MMYDGKTLKAFTERAIENYKQLIKSGTEYDVTIALCTLCGILSILDDEVRKCVFEDFTMPEYIRPLPNFTVSPDKDNNNKNIAIIRHFRNSLCHFRLDKEHIKPNPKNQIEEIIFEDYYEEKLKFSCSLKADEIGKFLTDISDHIIEKHKHE